RRRGAPAPEEFALLDLRPNRRSRTRHRFFRSVARIVSWKISRQSNRLRQSANGNSQEIHSIASLASGPTALVPRSPLLLWGQEKKSRPRRRAAPRYRPL